MNNIPVDETIVEDDPADNDDMDMDLENGNDDEPSEDKDEGEWGGIMDVDGGEDGDDDTPAFFKELKAADAVKTITKTPSKRPKSKVALVVREKVRKILEDVTELADKRARMLDETDFLKLLIGQYIPSSLCFFPSQSLLFFTHHSHLLSGRR